jgi:hypothetical protein
LAQSRNPLLICLTLVQSQRRWQTRIPRMMSSLTLAAPGLRMSLMALRMSSSGPPGMPTQSNAAVSSWLW